MRRRRIISSGGVEALIGILFFGLSVSAGLAGRIPITSVLWDTAALVAVFLSLFRLKIGVASSIVVIVGVLVFDPHALGTSLYLCMLPAATAIRQRQIPLAVVVTAVNGVAGWIVSYRLAGDRGEIGGPLLTWVVFYGVVWAIGLGYGAADKAAAERTAKEFRQRQLEVALELHDSVARNLSILAMQADAARLSGSATPSELEIMADQARFANRSIRQVTRLLGAEDRYTKPVLSGASALNAGSLELERLGFVLETTGELNRNLPTTIDVTAGQILQEALHNVAKHGNPDEPCLISYDTTTEDLKIEVRNASAGRRIGNDDGWGLKSMSHRAEALGGSVETSEENGRWTCRIRLPKSIEESSMGKA